MNCILVSHGAGRHLVVQNLDDLPPTLLLGFLSRIMYQLVLWTTKLAICAFYRRVFQDRWSKIFVWSMMAIVPAFSLPLVILSVFHCKPIEGKLPYIIIPSNL